LIPDLYEPAARVLFKNISRQRDLKKPNLAGPSVCIHNYTFIWTALGWTMTCYALSSGPSDAVAKIGGPCISAGRGDQTHKVSDSHSDLGPYDAQTVTGSLFLVWDEGKKAGSKVILQRELMAEGDLGRHNRNGKHDCPVTEYLAA
jgi:hypothetical protein